VSAAVDPVPPTQDHIWCSTTHPLIDTILCKRLINHPGLHRSDNGPDWIEPPTPNEEIRNG